MLVRLETETQTPLHGMLTWGLGETDVRPDSTAQGTFLERERALLGEDADLFAANDNPSAATVEDGDDDDLLGGDDFVSAPQGSGGAGQNDLDTFESSFPAIDTRNDVRSGDPRL